MAMHKCKYMYFQKSHLSQTYLGLVTIDCSGSSCGHKEDFEKSSCDWQLHGKLLVVIATSTINFPN